MSRNSRSQLKVGVAALVAIGTLQVPGVADILPSATSSSASVDSGSNTGGEAASDNISGCNDLSSDQRKMAHVIWHVSEDMGIPERGRVVAYATAMQESNMQNLDHGHADSLGMFQQRPSQGWGSPAQVTNPEYATRTFYQALRQVEGWQSMPVTEAAQTVQRSAYPNAYADHPDEARAVVDANGCT